MHSNILFKNKYTNNLIRKRKKNKVKHKKGVLVKKSKSY